LHKVPDLNKAYGASPHLVQKSLNTDDYQDTIHGTTTIKALNEHSRLF